MPLPQAVAAHPEKAAHVMAASGATVTFAQLDDRSLRLSRALRSAGVGSGDVVAVLLENHVRFPEVYWGVIRRGATLTPVNRYLTSAEVAYILEDSGARALITSAALGDVAAEAVERAHGCSVQMMMDGAAKGFDSYEEHLADQSGDATSQEEPQGDFMNYSSGTTGRPKGVRRAILDLRLTDPSVPERLFSGLLGLDDQSMYLSTAPLFHSAPLATTMAVQACGGTAVIMERFDAEQALRLIEQHRVTHSQWVPTMFVRLLKLDSQSRTAYDLSSHRVAVHAAAPCPLEVKKQMLDWWGPMISEYYGGTELNGLTFITAEEWLDHPGSVGRPVVGTVHICDDAGDEVPLGEPGLVYFERDERPFEYHNDPEKTRAAEHPEHPAWTTIGDIGVLDADGYLYLNDRDAFTIISGGVNIYPREIEDALVVHPSVADVAVFGIPDDEMGEKVVAIVQPAPGVEPGPSLANQLMAFAAERLARFKLPRIIEFDGQLPRLDNGKLYKAELASRYRAEASPEPSRSGFC